MPSKQSFKVQSIAKIIDPIDMVIYHANCIDGFASALIVWQKYPDAKFIAASHGTILSDEIVNCNNQKILLVDFSYPKEVIEKLAVNNQISILDHHISAFEGIGAMVEDGSITGEINSHYSGCSLTWQYFNPKQKLPKLFQYIEDIDLWNLSYPETKSVTLALNSYPFDFKVWSELLSQTDKLQAEGEVIAKYLLSIQKELLKHAHKIIIDEFTVPALNAPGAFASELGNQLAQKKPFAAIYYIMGDAYKISLRSTENGEDVAKIAERFGGGGHQQAASFKIAASELANGRIQIKK